LLPAARRLSEVCWADGFLLIEQKLNGIDRRTGGLFALPHWVGIRVGGVGCKSCIYIAHPGAKRLIPFDTFNMFYRGELESTRLAALRNAEVAAVE